MNVIRFIVALGLSKLSVANLLAFARLVKTSISGNANFPSPDPTITQLNTAINNLNNEKQASYTPGKTARVRQYAIELRQVMTDMGAYVEAVANQDAEKAQSVIESASMRMKRNRETPENGFRIKTTGMSGQVQLRTKFYSSATFAFASTLTPNDASTYVQIYSGTRASFLASGLTSGKRYSFRFQKTDKNGPSDWSDPKNIIVP